MTRFVAEWTGRRHASDADESRADAAAQVAEANGASWSEIATAYHAALTVGWYDPDAADNYTLTTRDLQNAAPLMDDDLREAVHDTAIADDPREFLTEYRRRHEAKYGEAFAV